VQPSPSTSNAAIELLQQEQAWINKGRVVLKITKTLATKTNTPLRIIYNPPRFHVSTKKREKNIKIVVVFICGL
jgi:hypothetical protein